MATARFSVAAMRESFLAQLTAKGLDYLHFEELVEKYLFLYAQEKELRADVKALRKEIREARKADVDTSDEEDMVRKDLQMILKLVAQEVTILEKLGLKDANAKPEDDGELM